MNPVKGIGIVLIVAGTLGLVYGGVSYTKEHQAAKIGPIELSMSQKETVAIPTWLSVGAIVVGAASLLLSSKR
ncbi:MAG: hypothetical protein C0487_04460 [Leptothrix sp. (in: Bacteria)]|uniref:hypothetical protein n=1 Tax=Aquabacterium sp. CECT 9606 TaxID=2845822 RepID=UPI001E538129|nr:hypothetical protein [Aquabacterium sp. CECT 9606]MBA4108830.1 hypothetical protein [Leptothrix sp. (in: b-proteobacteria)]CAH0354957.1 hypothetical protein AQB9606_04085 [Aquabacterium sp. CECT 9606]